MPSIELYTADLPEQATFKSAEDVYTSVLEDRRIDVVAGPTRQEDESGRRLGFVIDAADFDETMFAFGMARDQLVARTRFENASQRIQNVVDQQRKTIVVNLYGGPGAGKTTAAFEIMEKLKKAGYVVEYAPEFAKELVWTMNDPKVIDAQRALAASLLDGSYSHQQQVYSEQLARVRRLVGQCDFVVTDSPIALSLMYLKPEYPAQYQRFESMVLSDMKDYESFNMVVKRSGDYEQAGRVQNPAEAAEIDGDVVAWLDAQQIYYGTYDHDSIDTAIRNAIKTHERVTGVKAKELTSQKKEAPSKGGRNMAETNGAQEKTEWVNFSIPKTGYQGRELARAFQDKSGNMLVRIELPPHTPMIETEQGLQDLSHYSFLVVPQAVRSFENDPNYYNVSCPSISSKTGEKWQIQLQKSQGHWENPDGATREEKGNWVSDKPLAATIYPEQLREAMNQFREDRRAYAIAQGEKDQVKQPFVKNQQQRPARKPEQDKAAQPQTKPSVGRDVAAATRTAQAQEAGARARTQTATR